MPYGVQHVVLWGLLDALRCSAGCSVGEFLMPYGVQYVVM